MIVRFSLYTVSPLLFGLHKQSLQETTFNVDNRLLFYIVKLFGWHKQSLQETTFNVDNRLLFFYIVNLNIYTYS